MCTCTELEFEGLCEYCVFAFYTQDPIERLMREMMQDDEADWEWINDVRGGK